MRLPEGWKLTPQRAAVHEPSRTAVIADLHLGYTAARRVGGDALPTSLPGPMRQRLRQLVEEQHLRRLIIAGDLVERGRSGRAAVHRFVQEWRRAGMELHHVAGNHDARLESIPDLHMHGEQWQWAGAIILHHADEVMDFSIMGHLHPVIRDRGRLGQAACFLQMGLRLVLPAQADDAAGANVLGMKGLDAGVVTAIVADQLLELGTVADLRRQLKSRCAPRIDGPRAVC